ncbi:cell division protein FtsZ [Rhizobium skierniewicense]|uniref:cell division protein FtsZ n=1 Tax=Rhizobium skierniewicense TaxID=984260 RepID=UPI00157196F5|nr:cell division protein FtsZ [Rhizobium skierniewicense]NTF34452.1 cell division protein FtsZ [Rhizobium skierniewicense]
MTERLHKNTKLATRIAVIGVGGAGGNAVDNMIAQNLSGVSFLAANTDAQALSKCKAPQRIQLGLTLTEGLGAGSLPAVGKAAAEESIHEILELMAGYHMCFIAAGMGGGTGTGAAPVIARALREAGILTVAVVTEPFVFEGTHRLRQAKEGIERLLEVTDTVIVVPNQSVIRVSNADTTLAAAFAAADAVLFAGVGSVVDLILKDGLVNLDFADVKSVMHDMGRAVMGTGEAAGEGRATAAAQAAIENPLFGDALVSQASGALVLISAGDGLTLFEVDEAAGRIRESVDENADIIFGATTDETLADKMRVSIVATGLRADQQTTSIERVA